MQNNKLPRVKSPRFSSIISFGSGQTSEISRNYVSPSLHPRINNPQFSRSENKLAVIGAGSMVGSRFCELYQGEIIKADFKGKISVDITNFQSIDNFFSKYNFEWIILFSAFTDVDGAERQRGQKDGSCWQLNVEGVKNVVSACLKHKRKLIFISTDFVFDGTAGPYSEDDQVGPKMDKVSWYGITKIESEKFVQENLPGAMIVRIAYPYRSRFTKKDDIAKRVLRLYGEKKLYPMFADQTITPTFIDDLSPAIAILIKKKQSGIFHIASPIPTTHYEFAKKVIEVFGGNPNDIVKSSIRDLLEKGGSTPRPVNGGLKVDKIKNLGFYPSSWETGIEKIFEQSRGKLI